MASTPRPNRLLRLSVVGAAVVTDRGQIVGATSTGPLQQTHGFLLRDGAGGPFTPIDVPARNQPTPPMGRTV